MYTKLYKFHDDINLEGKQINIIIINNGFDEFCDVFCSYIV